MVSRVGPIKMVAYSEHDVSGLLIRAYHVDEVSLLDRQLSSSGLRMDSSLF
jgi:hypothetical protein